MQAIVDKAPVVASAVLVSALHLLGNNAEIVKRWTNEIQEAVNSKSNMVQVRQALLTACSDLGRPQACCQGCTDIVALPHNQPNSPCPSASTEWQIPSDLDSTLLCAEPVTLVFESRPVHGAVPWGGAAACTARWGPPGRQQAGHQPHPEECPLLPGTMPPGQVGIFQEANHAALLLLIGISSLIFLRLLPVTAHETQAIHCSPSLT